MTEERIKELELRIEEEDKKNWDKDYVNENPRRRMELEIELLRHGCRVNRDIHGLLVNGKFIVAIAKNKWCVKGKNVWYYYKDIPSLVNKYINKE